MIVPRFSIYRKAGFLYDLIKKNAGVSKRDKSGYAPHRPRGNTLK